MPKRNLIWIAVTLLVACGLALLLRPAQNPTQPEADPLEPLHRLHALSQDRYYRTVGPEVVDGALRGYLAELDPYCQYIPPAKPEYINRIVRGRRFDLGIHYEIVDGQVRIIGPVPNSPAYAAGVLAGDILLAIGGHTLGSPDRLTIEQLAAGKEGTHVSLLVARDDKPVELDLTRRDYPVETVTGLYRSPDGQWCFLIDPVARLAYVRIGEFANGTGEALDDVMRPLLGEGVRGMVLDLRDNPGGPLREAVEVADRFLDDGLIVLTRGRKSVEQRYPAHASRTYPDMHLAVLINEHTVSAPEVVAGAIREHGRGMLIGTRTFGKDLIQRPFPLGDDMGEVLLTTAQYAWAEPEAATTTQPTTAENAPAESGGGIEPHVRVAVSDLAASLVHVHRYRAAALPAPLPTTRPAATEAAQEQAEREHVRRIAGIDPPLAEALRVLRGLTRELPETRPADPEKGSRQP